MVKFRIKLCLRKSPSFQYFYENRPNWPVRDPTDWSNATEPTRSNPQPDTTRQDLADLFSLIQSCDSLLYRTNLADLVTQSRWSVQGLFALAQSFTGAGFVCWIDSIGSVRYVRPDRSNCSVGLLCFGQSVCSFRVESVGSLGTSHRFSLIVSVESKQWVWVGSHRVPAWLVSQHGDFVGRERTIALVESLRSSQVGQFARVYSIGIDRIGRIGPFKFVVLFDLVVQVVRVRQAALEWFWSVGWILLRVTFSQ